MTLTTLAFLIIAVTLPVSLIAVKAIEFGYRFSQSTKLDQSKAAKA